MKLDRRVIAVLAVLVVVLGGLGLWLGQSSTPEVATAPQPPATQAPATQPPAPPPAERPQAGTPAAPPAAPPAPAPERQDGLAMQLAERTLGRADAPVTVIEYFSLTCGHCANFHRDTWPQVRRELVETGRVRFVFRDFPLDQVALTAAAVARSLPPERYEPFVSTLFATQERWAFGQNAREELARLAALAGMSREQFEAAANNEALQRAILEARLAGQRQHNVNSTPTFVIGNRSVPGNLPFDRFAALVAEAR